MKTFQSKAIVSKEDLNYLWDASDEVCDYYNSMMNEVRVDNEINFSKPKEDRKYISNYDLQKRYTAKVLGIKPKFILATQVVDCSDKLFISIRSFWEVLKSNPCAKFPKNEKHYNKFQPLYFSCAKSPNTLKFVDRSTIQLTFQNKKHILVHLRYNKKNDIRKLKLTGDGHKLIMKNGQLYFHFCYEKHNEFESTNKSIYIDLGQKDLVTGFCPETSEIFKVSGDQLVDKELTKRKEVIQSLRDKKVKRSRRYNKLQNRFRQLQLKETNKKRTFLHKVSKKIVINFDTIVVGDLKDIKKNTKSPSSTVNKYKFQFWPVALFVDMVDYKASSSNRLFYKINESFTTKRCCRCGHLKAMSLSDRTYQCGNCGLTLERDSNSAINIHDKFLQLEPKLFNLGQLQNRTELIDSLKMKILRVI